MNRVDELYSSCLHVKVYQHYVNMRCFCVGFGEAREKHCLGEGHDSLFLGYLTMLFQLQKLLSGE
jgi:hypothetical protein